MAGADKFFNFDAQDIVETVRGVDGKMTAAVIFTTTALTVTVAPNSDTHRVFNAVSEYQNTTLTPAKIIGTIVLPSIGRAYTFDKAFLKNLKFVPEGAKMLGDLDYKLDIERLYLSPI